MTGPGTWSARIRLPRASPAVAERLERSLGPEAAREVPRARVTVGRAGALVDVTVEARDTGALRAALNTYLGWVQLADATERVIRVAARSEALI